MKIITLKEAIDKQLEDFKYSTDDDRILLMFAGDVAVTLGIHGDFDGASTLGEVEFKIEEFGDEVLIAAGFVTEKELSDRRLQEQMRVKQERYRRERAEYQRLHVIYGHIEE